MNSGKGSVVRVQTFMGKVSIEGLHQMDNHINEWLRRRNAKPLYVAQCFGADRHHDGRSQEPIMVTSVWYEEEAVDQTA